MTRYPAFMKNNCKLSFPGSSSSKETKGKILIFILAAKPSECIGKKKDKSKIGFKID